MRIRISSLLSLIQTYRALGLSAKRDGLRNVYFYISKLIGIAIYSYSNSLFAIKMHYAIVTVFANVNIQSIYSLAGHHSSFYAIAVADPEGLQ